MGNENTGSDLFSLIKAQKKNFEIVLPDNMNKERFMRIVLSAFRTDTDLSACGWVSVLGSIMHAAQLGLEPNTLLGHSYLVPFGKTCQLIAGYKGLLHLAAASGVDIVVNHVYEKELKSFRIEYGDNPSVSHTPVVDGSMRGEKIGVYAIAYLPSGRKNVAWRTMEEINNARPSHWTSTPWKKYPEDMERKTVVRWACKWIAIQNPSLKAAIAGDEHFERGGSLGWDQKNRRTTQKEPPIIDVPANPTPADFDPENQSRQEADEALLAQQNAQEGS